MNLLAATYHSVGLISVGGCWPSWVLCGSPSVCGYLPFCGSNLCGWLLTQLGSPWVAQRVWVPTILWVWSMWVVVDPVGFSVGRPVGVGTYCSVGLISVGGCWPSWALHGSPSGCGYLPFCGSDLCGWVLTQLGSPWVAQWVWGTYHSVGLISVGGCWPNWVLHGSPSGCGYLPFCGSDLCGWVFTQLGSPWVAQRVWAMPQCVMNDISYFISASAANKRKTNVTSGVVQPG